MERRFLDVKRGSPIYQEWRDLLETIGKQVRIGTGQTLEEAYAESVDEDGNLLLRQADGNLVRIVSGDVTLRE